MLVWSLRRTCIRFAVEVLISELINQFTKLWRCSSRSVIFLVCSGVNFTIAATTLASVCRRKRVYSKQREESSVCHAKLTAGWRPIMYSNRILRRYSSSVASSNEPWKLAPLLVLVPLEVVVFPNSTKRLNSLTSILNIENNIIIQSVSNENKSSTYLCWWRTTSSSLWSTESCCWSDSFGSLSCTKRHR